MSFGVMGGDMQPQGHLQTVVRMLDYDQTAAGRVRCAALEGQPRLHASTSKSTHEPQARVRA